MIKMQKINCGIFTKSISDMKTLKEYLAEEQQRASAPFAGDYFSFDLMEGESIVDTYVLESTDDGVVVAGDDRTFELLESYDFVLEAEYQGRDVELNKPMAGDVKKFKVYVKDPKTGNVKKVNFGQKGVKIKKNNPERRKSFRARHNCDNPGPKTKARYWSCRKW